MHTNTNTICLRVAQHKRYLCVSVCLSLSLLLCVRFDDCLLHKQMEHPFGNPWVYEYVHMYVYIHTDIYYGHVYAHVMNMYMYINMHHIAYKYTNHMHVRACAAA